LSFVLEETMPYIVVLPDGETWEEVSEDMLLVMVNQKELDELKDGTKPKHMRGLVGYHMTDVAHDWEQGCLIDQTCSSKVVTLGGDHE
jgi:hypothetical protein